MASNDTIISDEDGAYSDWIELYNGSGSTVNLDGWHLTDDAIVPNKWTFPATQFNAGQHLLIFASSKDRAIAGSELHTNFKLTSGGEYLGLYDSSGNLIFEYSPSFPAQTTDVAYGLPNGSTVPAYLNTPTPGSANSGSGIPKVQFSQESRLFSAPFNLILSANLNNGDVIRYTTDGSEPNGASSAYTAPFAINQTQRVRAKVFRNGSSGASTYAAFVMVDPALTSFNSDLPLVVVDTFGTGLVQDQPLTETFVAVIEPGNGNLADRTTLLDPTNYAGLAGLKIRGSSSAGFPKKQYKVELWDDTGEQVKSDLLGMGSDSDWVLYAPGLFDRARISNPLIHDLASSIGSLGMDSRFVELYFNDNNGTVAADDYDGIYSLFESIKRDNDRVDIESLSSTQNSLPDLSGGYLIDANWIEEERIQWVSSRGLPTLRPDRPNERRSMYGLLEPKSSEISAVQLTYIKNYIETFETALFGNNPDDPSTGYRAYIDVDSFINQHILWLLSKNPDALRLSSYYHKPRGEKLFAGPVWDFDRSMGSIDPRTIEPAEITDGAGDAVKYFEHDWYGPLFQSDDFYIDYIDRWYELRRGELSTTQLNARVDGLHAEIVEAYPREDARWGANNDYRSRFGGLQGEIDYLKNWLQQRATFFDNYFEKPPTFNQFGGIVPNGFGVSIAGGGGNIYYTLDGSDPRAIGGTLSPSAIVYNGSFALNQSTQIKARTFSSQGWSAIATPIFNVDPVADASNLLLSEIHYHPQTDGDTEFIELKNIGSTRIDLTGVRLTGGVTMTLGFTTLEPNQHLVLVKDSAAFNQKYQTQGTPYYYANIINGGEWQGSLSNGGETVTLSAMDRTQIAQVVYSDDSGWPEYADGNGSSLELDRPFAILSQYSAPTNWNASSELHGSPGRDGFPRGDVNCDGGVNVLDALFIMQVEVQLRQDFANCPLNNSTTEGHLRAGDVNYDGQANVIDALFIMQCDVEIPNVFCP